MFMEFEGTEDSLDIFSPRLYVIPRRKAFATRLFPVKNRYPQPGTQYLRHTHAGSSHGLSMFLKQSLSPSARWILLISVVISRKPSSLSVVSLRRGFWSVRFFEEALLTIALTCDGLGETPLVVACFGVIVCMISVCKRFGD